MHFRGPLLNPDRRDQPPHSRGALPNFAQESLRHRLAKPFMSWGRSLGTQIARSRALVTLAVNSKRV
jgi:hypothetical protein